MYIVCWKCTMSGFCSSRNSRKNRVRAGFLGERPNTQSQSDMSV